MDKALTHTTRLALAFCIGLLLFYMLTAGTIPQWSANAFFFSSIGFLSSRITDLQSKLDAQRNG